MSKVLKMISFKQYLSGIVQKETSDEKNRNKGEKKQPCLRFSPRHIVVIVNNKKIKSNQENATEISRIAHFYKVLLDSTLCLLHGVYFPT